MVDKCYGLCMRKKLKINVMNEFGKGGNQRWWILEHLIG